MLDEHNLQNSLGKVLPDERKIVPLWQRLRDILEGLLTVMRGSHLLFQTLAFGGQLRFLLSQREASLQ